MQIAKKKFSISIIIACIYVIYIIVDSNHEQFLYRAIALLFVWLITCFFENLSRIKNSLFNKYTIPVYVFLSFILITGQFNGDLIYTLKQTGYYTVFFSPLFMFFYYFKYKNSSIKKMVYIILIAFLYATIVSTIYYANNPDIARRMASGLYIEDNISMIGGYSLAYSAVISITFFLEIILKNGKVLTAKLKFLIIALIVSQILLVIYTRSTLTLIWLIIGIVFVFISRIKGYFKHKTFSALISAFSILLFALIFIAFREQIGLYLYTLNPSSSNIVNLRINSIGEFLLGYNLNSNHFIYRIKLPIISLRSFASSPVIGVGYQYGYYADRIYGYLGGHGEWADMLGSTGLIGFTSYIFGLIIIPLINHKKTLYNKVSYSYLLILFFLGLFNPLRSIHLTITIFLFIPLFSSLYSQLLIKNVDIGKL